MRRDRAVPWSIDIPNDRIVSGATARENEARQGTMVTLLLFGETLRQALGASEFQCEVSEPMTFKALLERNQDHLGVLLPFMNKGELLITVNRKVGGLDSKVKDGDTVKLTHQFNPVHDGAMWQNP